MTWARSCFIHRLFVIMNGFIVLRYNYLCFVALFSLALPFSDFVFIGRIYVLNSVVKAQQRRQNATKRGNFAAANSNYHRTTNIIETESKNTASSVDVFGTVFTKGNVTKLKTKTTTKKHNPTKYIYFQRSKGVCACDLPEDLYANIQLNVKSNAAARIHCAFRQIKLCVLYLLFCKIMCFIHLLFSSKLFCHAMDLSSWYPFSSQSCMFNRCK